MKLLIQLVREVIRLSGKSQEKVIKFQKPVALATMPQRLQPLFSLTECVDKKEDSRIQSDVEELIARSNQNKFQLNESKCKELRISFAKSAADFAPIVINGKAIEVVSTVKLLGLNMSSDLRWNCRVAEISEKVASGLYFLKQLKGAHIPAKDLLIFYLTCIRPVTEYACPVFHNALPASRGAFCLRMCELFWNN